MLSIYYEGVDAGIRHPLGELSKGLYLAGRCLLGSDNVVFAFIQNGLWRTPQRNYAVLGITRNVILWFDDHATCSEKIGPFESIRLVSGSVWADAALLARYDESRDEWTRSKDEHPWPVILMQQSGQPPIPVPHWEDHVLPQLT